LCSLVAVSAALNAAGSFDGKPLFSSVNCLKPDMRGLVIGTTTSAAEKIAREARDANVVEAIPPMAQILAAPSRRLRGRGSQPFTAVTT
jgi:8-hydroxy-5-deazaflavin:NADPH oxidoreductase